MQAQGSTKLRNIVITGANKGIGYAIIEVLLKGPTAYNIILTARSVELGQKAVEELKKAYPQATSKVTFRQLNLSDAKSQDAFAGWVKKDLVTIDVLVNNAGLGANQPTNQQSYDIINTNFINTVNLTNKLLPYLAADGKILNISSRFGSLSFQKEETLKILDSPSTTEEQLLQLGQKLANNYLNGVDQQQPDYYYGSYFISKALLNAWGRLVLSKKLKGEQSSYTICPGWCQTDMGSAKAPLTAEQGADTPVYVINLPFSKSNELNGHFLGERAIVDWAIELDMEVFNK